LRWGAGVITSFQRGLLQVLGLAFWFAALNSFLGDERPQDVLATDPGRDDVSRS
jgi:hypothetical protein